jgi:hypothetical protein
MTCQAFLRSNGNTILGYYLLTEASAGADTLGTPYPSEQASADALEILRYRLTGCMPVDSMIMDLWDWDIHFENDLDHDWYFDAVFGSPSSIAENAHDLASFFHEKVAEFGTDYDQSKDYPDFEELVAEEAERFIISWRKNVFERCAQPGANVTSLPPARS